MDKGNVKSKITHGLRRAFQRNNSLSVGARWLIWVLMGYKGSSETCWPSQRTLEKIARVDHRTVRRWVRELERAGYLKTRRRGKNKSLEYWPSYIPKYKLRSLDTQNSLKSAGVVSTYKEGVKKTKVRVWRPSGAGVVSTYT